MSDGDESSQRGKRTPTERMDRYVSSSGETPEAEETSKTGEASETLEASETSETEEIVDQNGTFEPRLQWVGGTSVRDRANLNFYLPDEIKAKIEATYLQLNIEYQQQYGEKLKKHEQYYPHLLEQGLNEDDLREQLGLI
ncbi:hypothetical protein [Halorubrum sp. AJ67]|uniref:hypothetical protein n=1 Tax=Halorubrum sp. AJ67 TaxID=1173487 RepID=UPI0003DBAFE8|nr:hypothetical protein [Halorubrum sp. AJ67]CDK39460.1 hypothetical protein BN903_12 [Halorubrum sp. AJ67]